MKRRRFLAAALSGTVTGMARFARRTTAVTSPADRSAPDAVGLETLASGFEVPLDVAFAPAADRRYVAEQRGLVHVHESDGLRDEPFLDLREAVEVDLEMGLLGVALHPDFAENRRVFVRYSAPPREGTPSGYSHTFVLAEFEASDDGRRAKRDSERTLLKIPEPQPNHNSGNVLFGPDGYLYVGVGDGGGGGDLGNGHVDDWYDTVPGGNGQDVTENLLGSVLRIDVDGREDELSYAVPDGNPLVDAAGRDEHYAWGFRNPWGMSFDGEDLLVADVGQNAYEEVNLVEKGGNYGWNVKEGTHCYNADDCPDETPDGVRGGEPLVDPVVEYAHDAELVSGNAVVGENEYGGTSVVGGYVYRGSALPGLTNEYVFADLNTSGRLFVASRSGGDDTWPVRTVEVAADDADKLRRVIAFGRDDDGELYVLGQGTDSGGLHRVESAG